MEFTIFLSLSLVFSVISCVNCGEVIYAVNAGGSNHIDSSGIHYIRDPLNIGVPSDYGQRFHIRRVPADDQILYQTERWHSETFGYDIPVQEDGDYVLVLKFSEVYFNEAQQKVFNVQMNDNHDVVSNLDIYDAVGHATAHDEIIPFTIKSGKLSVNEEVSTYNGILNLKFVKGLADNPKICAFYIMRGKMEDVTLLAPIDHHDQEEEDDDDDDAVNESDDITQESQTPTPSYSDQAKRDKLKSGPPAINPYAEDSSSLILPIIVAFCAFIPALVCLCRL